MNETFEIDRTTSAPSVGRMLSRGAMKRCPAYGAGRLFSRDVRLGCQSAGR